MRKIILIVLLAVLALAPTAWAQAPRGYYDQYGRYQEQTQNDGYYDRNGQWHAYDYDNDGYNNGGRRDGYYDSRGVWHPNDTRYYDSAVGPERWTWSDNRGRAESLVTAARNFALTARTLDREAARRSRYDDRATLETLRRLDEQAQYFARVVQLGSRGNGAGRAYADLVNVYYDARNRFGALEPDSWLSNQFHVLSAALGRLDKRFFGSRAFGGRVPDEGGYGYGNDRYGYDRYGNPLPGYDRDGRDSRPYPY